MQILNLTQHPATAEQAAQGVVEPVDKTVVQRRLTFETLPSKEAIATAASELAALAKASGMRTAMIGGAPFFMPALDSALRGVGVEPVYAFSVRESAEQTMPDGSVRKVNVFKHVGFVRA